MTLGIIVITGIICLIIWKISEARNSYLIRKHNDAHLHYTVEFPHPIHADQARVKEFISSEFRIEVMEKYLELCTNIKEPVPNWIFEKINARLKWLHENLAQ